MALLAFVAVYLLAAAVLLLTGDGWAVNRLNVRIWILVTAPLGLQGVVSPEQFAALANVVLFLPPFAAVSVLRPTWLWLLVGIGVSVTVEVFQSSLATRIDDPWDVVMNTLGTAAGIGIGLLVRRRLNAADAGEPTIPAAPRGCSGDVPDGGPDDRD